MGAGGNARPIIKRKKVVSGDGHHGGAWKVAYADFVTAMMAFFLLMWLLNATTEKQLKGLADYFSPSVPISRTSGGSDGMFGGDSLESVMTLADDGRETAHGIMGEELMPRHQTEAGTAAADPAQVAALQAAEDVLLGRGGESLVSDLALRHVLTRLTDEGLVIEIFALPGVPLFDGESDVIMPMTAEVIGAAAELFASMPNKVAISAHLPARPVMLADNPIWDRSADRADAVRRALEAAGLDPARIARVAGHADRSPAMPDAPAAERNDRIEIILLRGEGMNGI